MEIIAKIMLAMAALVALWFVIRGLMDMQSVNGADEEVLELSGVVRQLTPHGRYDAMAVLTLNVDDEVVHADCLLPGAWIGRRKYQVTDLIPVLWRRGEAKAVAVQSIRDGQRMFVVGFGALVLAAVLFVVLF